MINTEDIFEKSLVLQLNQSTGPEFQPMTALEENIRNHQGVNSSCSGLHKCL